MPFRTLVVHLCGDEKSSQRLRFAAGIARSLGARLTGLFARLAVVPPVGVSVGDAPADYAQAEAAARAEFEQVAQGLEGGFQDLRRFAEADLISQMVDYSRHFDLVVLGQGKTRTDLVPPDLAEQIIVLSGRPALVLPEVGEFSGVGKRPIFAWSDSRSSARGFADGLGLVKPGADALIVSLSKPEDKDVLAYRKQSLNLAAAHLAAHGVTARTEQLALSEIGLMDALLNRASDHSADLLAIGAFGGGGYPLFSRGSGSRYMLKHMTLPVLFSH